MTDAASPAEDRAARLAASLRANLHKRKAQARAVRGAAQDDAVAKDAQPDM